VLITGGAGFTGRPLAERLRQDGHDVVPLSHGAGDPCAVNVDLCDFDAITRALTQIRPSAIVHLAGIAAPTHSKIGEMYAANVVGTANLFAALGIAKVEPRIIIVASSAQVYASPNAELPLTEDDSLAPKTHYAVSKRATEEIAAIYSRQFLVLITRPFNYTGPGQTTSFLVPKIVQHYAERRSELRLGNLKLFRDFSDIRRVVEAYARLLSRSIDATTVNICSGRGLYLADILKMMNDISGHAITPVIDPSLFRPDEPQSIIGSPSRLEALIGPLPNPAIRETLTRMYDAFRRGEWRSRVEGSDCDDAGRGCGPVVRDNR
jgi:nucleoside-diphosphate-sugar epimerase